MKVRPEVAYQAYRERAVKDVDEVWRAVWSLGMQAMAATARKKLVAFPHEPRDSFTADWPDPTINVPPDPPSPWKPRWKPGDPKEDA